MATYFAEPDTYAGWGTGRYFGLFGLAAGAVAFASWAYLHGHMRGMSPIDPADQMFLWWMQWVGGALFLLMAVCVWGSIGISAKSRGTVALDDVGVTRQIGRRTQILRWEEIEGLVVMPWGGVALIPLGSSPRIEIPNWLDNYRACIAEIKAMGVRGLPSDRLRASIRQRQWTWKRWLLYYAGIFAFQSAFSKGPHTQRILSLCAWVAIFCLVGKIGDDELAERWWPRLGAAICFCGLLDWLAYRVAHTW